MLSQSGESRQRGGGKSCIRLGCERRDLRAMDLEGRRSMSVYRPSAYPDSIRVVVAIDDLVGAARFLAESDQGAGLNRHGLEMGWYQSTLAFPGNP
jgi:hypothetical protein